MAFQWADNLHSTAFTPRDFQVELLAAAEERNIIVCLGHNSSKEFIALKLILERSYELRPQNGKKKVTIYITNETKGGESTYNLVFHLTDLKVINLNAVKQQDIDWETGFDQHQVVIMNIDLCLDALICSYVDLALVNLIIIEDCHKKYGCVEFKQLFEFVEQCEKKPKVLGLAGPLHSAGCQLDQLCFHLELLENMLQCKAETASDIVTVLRYCKRPNELVLQCAPPKECELTAYLRDLVSTKKHFLTEHRFDPFEIYSEEFEEELKGIPDPKQEPLDYLNQFLDTLNEFGPWCADRAALNLIMQIEKAKIKTPYERHYLLLCLASTALIQVRAHCDYVFQQLATEKERIETYSSPKVHRMFEMLRLFKPDKKVLLSSKESEYGKKRINELDSLNFNKLSSDIDSVTQKLQTDAKTSDQLQSNLSKILNADENEVSAENSEKNREPLFVKQPTNFRTHKSRKTPFHRTPRTCNNYHQNDPDALCGLIFCNSKFVAKILFSLLYEISKNDPDLDFLMVQYTVDRAADPLTETKQAENEHRKQEEVLKRFRMHSCNLLIGTSVLEEGIELPKCNLVIRWDPPTNYRSYVQCKGRARAQQAYHVIMVAPTIKDEVKPTSDQLSIKSHKQSCAPGAGFLKQNKSIDMNGDIMNETIINLPNQVITSEEVNGLDSPEDEKTELNHECEWSTPKIATIQNQCEENELQQLFDSYRCCADEEKEDVAMKPKGHHHRFHIMERETEAMVDQLAQYMQIEKILIRNCNNRELTQQDLNEAENYTACIKPYQPLQSTYDVNASVSLSTAILLINKYCAKLPSDTFTKLTPLWRCAKTYRNKKEYFQYTLRLPINSPLKMDILGLPMPSRTLARRMTALVACKVLHQSGELDDSLQPIGKEGFRASEPDWENFDLEKADEEIVTENLEPRPGTTRRRQYYYKRIASVFSDCRPTVNTRCNLYHIKMTLECPIPEEQNTRGRKIYPPEDAIQGFGILTVKQIPKLSAFSIYTRSGEVRVALELTRSDVILNTEQLKQINTFLRYSFSNVLRLQKYLMLFDPEATENSFFVVPTVRSTQSAIDVDWDFLQLIAENCNRMPVDIPENVRKTQEFDGRKFRDAVVMPWYRNQDQPQYFYVAEICDYLSPESSFPGDNYETFKEYYFKKYYIVIQNRNQPLLDVDHTSARLNFLTPRYVNRKGVALPTSSEETKRAKRENLEQKQILVPELCTVHPFPASLWRAAVCLPCILYRINALLLADEIRKQVAHDIGLGTSSVEDQTFEWPVLDFGWSLADVLKRAKETMPNEIKEDCPTKPQPTSKIVKENVSAKIQPPAENADNKTVNDILDEADKKIKNECFMEIGTWSNDMAENIEVGGDASDEEWGILPPNVNLCSRDNTNIRYGSPTSWDVTNVKNNPTSYYSDSDLSYQSDEDLDYFTGKNDDESSCLKIEFKSDNVAEAIETEEEIQKRQRQLEIINDINANEKSYQITKNIGSGYDCPLNKSDINLICKLQEHQAEFKESIEQFKIDIESSGTLVRYNDYIQPVRRKVLSVMEKSQIGMEQIMKLLPFVDAIVLKKFIDEKNCRNENGDIQLSLDYFYELNRLYFESNGSEKYFIEGSGNLFDRFNDSNYIEQEGNSFVLSLDYHEFFKSRVLIREKINDATEICDSPLNTNDLEAKQFSFDCQPDLNNHPGPSPSIILQALTMSNANDGINLERLETIGDSFLKYAITTYLYCTYENVHEGKLSHLRSRQVSNLNLYRLGKRKMLGESMIATKFEPHDNWLPPCYYVPKDLEKALIEAKIPACHWDIASIPNIKDLSVDEICHLLKIKAFGHCDSDDENCPDNENPDDDPHEMIDHEESHNSDDFPCFIPYNLVTQHSIPDKSIADCVEALIGAYLIDCGPRGALLFMAWLGIRVLPCREVAYDAANSNNKRITGSIRPYFRENKQYQTVYGYWAAPKSPLLHYAPNPYKTLDSLLDGYSVFEAHIGYFFKDRSYLLQAMTHASYTPNRLTDCYQRLEFLGDAVLDYLITRHLYEDPRQHSPGALTDLRSALVNNTIFASLAVRHGFHKYFRHLSPGLNDVIDRFVRIQHENGHSISEEFYLISEEECDEAEDVEVPKALGDVFESVAGAIFLDSNMSLDTVWKIYSNMMRPEIEQFSNSVPKSPIRELLELEPETAKFGKPEKLADGRRVRVTVDVFGKGTYRGIGRNYRIAKCTAAKCALRQLKKQGLINRRHQ